MAKKKLEDSRTGLTADLEEEIGGDETSTLGEMREKTGMGGIAMRGKASIRTPIANRNKQLWTNLAASTKAQNKLEDKERMRKNILATRKMTGSTNVNMMKMGKKGRKGREAEGEETYGSMFTKHANGMIKRIRNA